MNVGQKLPVIEYKNGTIDAQWIPYGRRWVLRGPRTTTLGRVDLALGRATRRSALKADTTRQASRPSYDDWACWVAPREPETKPAEETKPPAEQPKPDDPAVATAQAAAASAQAVTNAVQDVTAALKPTAASGPQGGNQGGNTFELTFGPHALGETYRLDLEFYHRLTDREQEWIDGALGAAYDAAYELALATALDAHKRQTEPSEASVKALFDSSLTDALFTLQANGDIVSFDMTDQGRCSEILIYSDLTQGQTTDLAQIVQRDVQSEIRTDTIQALRTRLRGHPLNVAFPPLVDNLTEIETSDQPLGLAQGDAALFRNAVTSGNPPQRIAIGRLKGALRKACPSSGRIMQAECDLFTQAMQELERLRIDLDSHDALQASLTSDKATSKARIIDNIKGAFFEGSGFARIQATSWDDAQATTDKLRIGTALSLGVAALSLGSPTDLLDQDRRNLAAFALYSLKFYVFAVDKSLPDPYYGRFWLGRTSFVLGFMRGSTVTYKGQELDHPTAIGSPFIGVGFDLTRYFTLQFGTVLVRQPSTIGVPGRGLSAAPVLSMGIDFDAANLVRTLLTGTNLLP